MKKYINLQIGDVIKVNSKERLSKVHLNKGYICGHSFDEMNNVVAYAVSIGQYCWTVLPDEVEPTGEFIDPNNDLSNVFIKTNSSGDVINNQDE